MIIYTNTWVRIRQTVWAKGYSQVLVSRTGLNPDTPAKFMYPLPVLRTPLAPAVDPPPAPTDHLDLHHTHVTSLRELRAVLLPEEAGQRLGMDCNRNRVLTLREACVMHGIPAIRTKHERGFGVLVHRIVANGTIITLLRKFLLWLAGGERSMRR